MPEKDQISYKLNQQMLTLALNGNIPMKIFIPIKFYIKQYQVLKIIPDSDGIVF